VTVFKVKGQGHRVKSQVTAQSNVWAAKTL